MTLAEMNRRLAKMNAADLARVERIARQSSYTARELSDVTRTPLLQVNAILQKIDLDD